MPSSHPQGYQQFEAIAYQRGADGKAHTADDVELGPIDVNWSVEEFYAVYRRRRQGVRRHAEQQRAVHADYRRSESAAQIQPQQLRRRLGGGHG